MNIHWSQFKSQLSSKMSCERKKNLKGGEEKKKSKKCGFELWQFCPDLEIRNHFYIHLV